MRKARSPEQTGLKLPPKAGGPPPGPPTIRTLLPGPLLALLAALILTAAGPSPRAATPPLEELARIERDPVRADPEAIETVLAACRLAEERACEARALLARAEAFAESALVDRVVEDAAAAEAILREIGGHGSDRARALLLQRGAGAGGGPAAVEAARRRYAEALELATEAGDLSTAGRLHCDWARVESSVQNWAGFTEHLEAAAELAGRTRLPRVAGCLAYQRGLSRYFQRDPAGARTIWGAFADSGLAVDAPRELLWILVGLSAASVDLADHRTALVRARQAVDLAESLQGIADGVGGWCNLATALYFHHRLGEAEETARICMERGREAGRPETEALGLLRLGGVVHARGDLTGAADLLQRSLASARERRAFPLIPWILFSLGNVLVDLGDTSRAGEHLEEALDLADRFGPPPQRAAIRTSLSWLRSLTGDAEEGGRLAAEALELLDDVPSPPLVAEALRARGLARYQAQDFQRALDDATKAVSLYREEEARRGEARAALDAGNALFRLNRLDLALERYRRARELARAAGARDLLAVSAGNILMLRRRWPHSSGQADTLLRLAREAVENAQGASRAVALINLSDLLRSLERGEEALAVAVRAVEASRGTGIPEMEVNALSEQALAWSLLGRDEEAVTLCRDLLGRLGTVSEVMRMRAEFRCGGVYLDAGDPTLAVRLLRRAVERAESSGRRLTRPDLKAAFIEDRVGFYALLVEALLAEAGGEPSPARRAEMLSVSERFRSRVLLEALEGSAAGEAQALGAASLSPAELQAGLPVGTAAVEYLLGLRASFVFLVTRDRLEVARLPGARSIDEQVMLFKGLLERRGENPSRDLDAIAATGSALYAMLLQPVLRDLSGDLSRLIVVPEGSLHHLPFETLVTGRRADDGPPRYLVEETRISLAPSLAFLSQLRKSRRPAGGGPSLVAFANPTLAGAVPAGGSAARPPVLWDLPPLPYSESEVRGLAAHFGGTRRLLSGPRASEGALREALASGAAVVHVASHGFLDPLSYGSSGILLSPSRGPGEDGLLEAREVLDLEVDAGLVVLSGCSTGTGRLVRGEGFLGLPHALFQSGARSIVMSLWAVGDRSAALLMERFYAGLAAGRAVGVALRRAKLDLIASGSPVLSHPAVWAPFVVAGLDEERLDLPPPRPSAAALWPVGLLAALLLGVAAAILVRRQGARRRA